MNQAARPMLVALVLAACSPQEAHRASAGKRLVMLPPDAVTFRVTVESDKLPDWFVEDETLTKRAACRLEVAAGRPVQVLLLPDADCLLEIPAMRAQVRGIPDRYQTTWFLPILPGTYEMRVTSAGKSYDGELVVLESRGS